MRILFVQDDLFKYQGIMLLSSIIKRAGHSCDVVVSCFHKDPVKEVLEKKPEMICFSLTSTKYPWFSKTAKKIKEKTEVPIVVGGPHPTFFPEMIKEDFVDYLCVGEGEEAFLELIEAIEKEKDPTKIRNIWGKRKGRIFKNEVRNLVANLDSLPDPDKALYQKYAYFRRLNVDFFIGSRGCPYNCSFCFNKKYNQLYKGKGKIIRRKSVERIIAEIKKSLGMNRNINHVLFEDDNLLDAPGDWLELFFKRYKRDVGLPFGTQLRADRADECLIKGLKNSGCYSLRVGLESADPYLREVLLKKGITNEQVIKAAGEMKKYGIRFQIYAIVGIPEETTEKALDTYEFVKKLRPTNSWCSLLQPFPGTEIMKIVLKKGLMKKQEINRLRSYFNETALDLPNKRELNNLQKLFQVGNLFRIPKKIMSFLVRMPENFFYNFLFKVFYALAIKSMDRYSWQNLIRTSYYLNRYY
jgi:anaerobic magnesium-protoporphyrin IX monomethyl ester cyclase